MFSYFLSVKLVPSEDGPEAQIEYRFPPGELPKADKTMMQLITQFCFPDKEKFPKMKLSSKNKKFTFVVTNVEGVKRFGYCHRELVGEIWQGKRWPICYCILSHTPCPTIFAQILEVATNLKEDVLEQFLQELRNQRPPLPGEFIMITLPSTDTAFKFDRPKDDNSLSGFANLTCLLEELDSIVIVSLLASMLLERRIIFLSHSLSVLSNCVQAAVALLHPFVWQHVFIPVLPLGMIQFVCAPVPFVVGLLKNHLPALEAQSDMMEEVLLVDLDDSTIVPPPQDYKQLPDELVIPLLVSINEARKALQRRQLNKSRNSQPSNYSLREAETPQMILQNGLASFFVDLVGNYESFLTPDGINVEAFIQSNPRTKAFLENFVGSQMWEQFIRSRIDELSAKRTGTFTKSSESNPSNQLVRTKSTQLSPLEDILLREGLMYKFGKGIKAAWAHAQSSTKDVGVWQLRYLKMTWTHLHYYRKKDDPEAAGSIDLMDISTVLQGDYHGKKDCLLIITKQRIYYLYSANFDDAMAWQDYLRYRIKDNKKLREDIPLPPLPQQVPVDAAVQADKTHTSFPQKLSSALLAKFSQTKLNNPEGEVVAGKEKARLKKEKGSKQKEKEQTKEYQSKTDKKLRELTGEVMAGLTNSFSKLKSFITKDRSGNNSPEVSTTPSERPKPGKPAPVDVPPDNARIKTFVEQHPLYNKRQTADVLIGTTPSYPSSPSPVQTEILTVPSYMLPPDDKPPTDFNSYTRPNYTAAPDYKAAPDYTLAPDHAALPPSTPSKMLPRAESANILNAAQTTGIHRTKSDSGARMRAAALVLPVLPRMPSPTPERQPRPRREPVTQASRTQVDWDQISASIKSDRSTTTEEQSGATHTGTPGQTNAAQVLPTMRPLPVPPAGSVANTPSQTTQVASQSAPTQSTQVASQPSPTSRPLPTIPANRGNSTMAGRPLPVPPAGGQ